jgi:hypothetical protein
VKSRCPFWQKNIFAKRHRQNGIASEDKNSIVTIKYGMVFLDG